MDHLERASHPWETCSAEKTAELLRTDPATGLTSEEAEKRLQECGPNRLRETKRKPAIVVFFEQMKDPMIYVLFAAIAVTIGVSIYETVQVLKAGGSFDFLSVGDWPDVIIILAVILLNALIGTIQELKAQSSLDALRKLSGPESTVLRDGKRLKIKSDLLVPGDVLLLEEGDTIGADIRLLETVRMKTNESSLTGESTMVEKDAAAVFESPLGVADRRNMAYMTTPVTYGRGSGIVVRTGMETEIGRIADALDKETEELTPLQKVLAKLSKTLGLLTILIVGLVLAANIVWIFVDGRGTQIEAFIEAVLSAISLAVAAIPEGLPAVVTIVLAIGVQKMVKVHTVVRRLPSVETLGAVSVICSDKTGTLTMNKMTVLEAYCNGRTIGETDLATEEKNEDREPELSLLAEGLSLCSNATVDEGVTGDPTEVALVVFANRCGLFKGNLEAKTPRTDELPFDSVRKMMTTVHRKGEGFVAYTKGAVDSILGHTTKILDHGQVRAFTQQDREKVEEANAEFSSRALRVLALAYREIEKPETKEEDLTFVGLVAMIDPARPEVAEAVRVCKEAGITPVMITGDHVATAFAIAKKLGICTERSQCRTGAEVDAMSEEELRETVKTARVFARVSPENKVQIVKAFKANGHIAAMTGDGVNDAPSLKSGDIGVAMGITGTDVAKDAADMVLTDDNFASIEKAVEEGRGIYANIKKTVCFLLSSNIAEVLTMFLLICIGLPAPLIAIHLLWVNLITDSLPAIALGMDPKDPKIMRERPRDPNESIFSGGGMRTVLGYGAVLTLSVILAYFYPGVSVLGSLDFSAVKALYMSDPALLLQARTMAFTSLALGELFHMLNMSDVRRSFVRVFRKKNVMMLVAFFAGLLLQLAVIEIPFVRSVFSTSELSWAEWLWTALFSLAPLLVHEAVVLVRFLARKIRKA
ncbi:MAG: cation-translocating P-type ATPase [Clostridia bacterium]|nr:cation-translocating P-type ATPase [Clostridia bacterium]